MGRPFTPHRPVVEGIVLPVSGRVPWRDLPVGSGRGRRSGSGTTAGPPTGPGTGCWPSCSPRPTRLVSWTGGSRRTPRGAGAPARRHRGEGRLGRRRRYTGGASNDKTRRPVAGRTGRSRHRPVPGRADHQGPPAGRRAGRPLVLLVSPGQAGDAPALLPMLAQLRVPRRGPGRPRTRPALLRGTRPTPARRHRQHLRRRGSPTVIPEPADQAAHRRRRGSAGGRLTYDPTEYRGRNVIERASTAQALARLATRYDKHALTYRGGSPGRHPRLDPMTSETWPSRGRDGRPRLGR